MLNVYEHEVSLYVTYISCKIQLDFIFLDIYIIFLIDVYLKEKKQKQQLTFNVIKIIKMI